MGDFEYVVKILNENKEILGTGLLLNKYVITVHHVIKGSESIFIEYKGEFYSCEIDYASDKSDVAFLKIDIDVKNKPDYLYVKEGKLPDEVLSKSYQTKGFLCNRDGYEEDYGTYSKGKNLTIKIISSLNYMEATKEYLYDGYYMIIESKTKVTPGFSGAPVYYDLDDNIIIGFIVARVLNEKKDYNSRIIPVQTYLNANDGKYRTLFDNELKVEIKQMPIEKKSIKCLTKSGAKKPVGNFIGRENMLKKIKKLLAKKSALILISGMGGVGKTEICKKIYYDIYENGLDTIEKFAWIEYKTDLKHSFYGQFKEIKSNDIEDYFEQTFSYLSEKEDKLLLFIDNIEDTISIEDIETLRKLNNRVIFTSRFIGFEGINPIEIDRLLLDECKKMYIKILNAGKIFVKVKDKENIKGIIKLADRHTLTVKLLAETQVDSCLNAEEFLNKLIIEGFDLKGIEKIKHDYKEDYLIEHLSKVFEISKLNDEEMKALKLFSLFPAINIEDKDAKEFFQQKDLKNLNNLHKKGWINRLENCYELHTVLASVIKHKLIITFGETEHIIKSIGNKLFFDEYEIFTNRVKYLPLADSIFKYFKDENLDIAYLYNNAGRIYEKIGNNENVLEDNNVDYEKALNYYQKALKIRVKILGKENSDTAISYNNIGELYSDKEDYEKALKYYFKALEIQEKILGKESPFTATSYNNIGLVCYYKGVYKIALDYYIRALIIRKKLLGKENPSTATSYNDIGILLHYIGKNEKALEFLNKALEIYKKILGEDHPKTIQTDNNYAIIFDSLSKKVTSHL